MTMGLTCRRTARRIKRLKETALTISQDYSDRPTPTFWRTRFRPFGHHPPQSTPYAKAQSSAARSAPVCPQETILIGFIRLFREVVVLQLCVKDSSCALFAAQVPIREEFDDDLSG